MPDDTTSNSQCGPNFEEKTAGFLAATFGELLLANNKQHTDTEILAGSETYSYDDWGGFGEEWLDDDWWAFMAIYFLYRTTGPKSGPPNLLQGQDDDRCLGHDTTEEAPGATQAPREGQSSVTRLLLPRQKERTRASPSDSFTI